MVSLGNEARSTASTRSPCRASSIAVVAPATRAPTTMTSYRPAPILSPLVPVHRHPYGAPYGTGTGSVELTSSRAGAYEVSFPKRAAEDADGATSPEELIGAARTAPRQRCFRTLATPSRPNPKFPLFREGADPSEWQARNVRNAIILLAVRASRNQPAALITRRGRTLRAQACHNG